MKKLKHLFTALLLLCCIGTATAHDFEVGGVYYNILSGVDKTVEVTYRGTSYNDYSNEYTGSVVIPESVTYNETTYSVTSIGNDAFYYCTGLTSIEIPSSVTIISTGAFLNCTGLTSITIPNSVTSIGNNAFRGCTGLTSVVIGNSVTSISSCAFYYCQGLTSITIPNSVTSIGNNAFRDCTGLTRISVESGNTIYDSRNNCNAIIETETNKLMAGCQNTIIPNSVTSIGDYAFNNCTGLTRITIPNSVTSIGNWAFHSCTDLTSIEIPNSVTSIGDYAFRDCTGLTNIEIPNSVTSIGNWAFHCCTGLKSIEFNAENCTRMGSSSDPVFSGCAALSTVIFGENVKNIPSYAFYGCTGLTSVVIGNSITSIGNQAFYNCSELNEVHISDLSAWCNISFGSSNANPLYYAKKLYLNDELITELTIPNSVRNIRYYAFYNCSGLTSITIPNSVTSIGDYAFYNCTGLKTVINFSNLTFSKGTGYNGYVARYADKVYNAPNGSIEEDFVFGKQNDVNTLVGYLGNATDLTLPADYNGEKYVIGNDAFKGCTGLTSIEIPNSVTSIGERAFRDCTGLTNIEIPNSVTSIGSSAFSGCTGLTSVEFNAENCTRMGSSSYPVFSGCAAFSTVTFGENVKNIPSYAFYGCSGLTSITIPNSVTSIGDYAFRDCTGLEKVCINDLAAWCGIDFGSADANPLYYAKNLYLNGELLTELSIPAEIAEVKDYTFYNCNGVTNIDIVDGVKSIGNSAFYGCSNLETLYISNTIESIGNKAFAECNNILDIKIGSKKAITASENIFSSDAYNNTCLYVPEGRKFAYEKTAPWSNFYIAEMDFTGIEELKSENGKVKTIYDLNGRAVEKPANGIYIIDGKKVLIK